MAVNISSISPASGYFSGASQTASITFQDTNPLWEQSGPDPDYYRYGVSFNLYSSSSGGTNYGSIGSYTSPFHYYPSGSPSTFSATVTISLTIPSGLSSGTYWVAQWLVVQEPVYQLAQTQ